MTRAPAPRSLLSRIASWSRSTGETPDIWGKAKPYIRLTPAGRKLARFWTGQTAYKAPSAGTLREWQWRALAVSYAASDAGLEGSYGEYAGIGWGTWLRLRDYRGGGLVEERGGVGRYRLTITAAGRRLYEREWARYQALYPDVEAPEPVAQP